MVESHDKIKFIDQNLVSMSAINNFYWVIKDAVFKIEVEGIIPHQCKNIKEFYLNFLEYAFSFRLNLYPAKCNCSMIKKGSKRPQ